MTAEFLFSVAVPVMVAGWFVRELYREVAEWLKR